MLDIIMDILFPQNVCCICREPGRFGSRHPWCEHCQGEMNIMQSSLPVCTHCGKYLETGAGLCKDCQQMPPQFNIARAVGPYEEPYRIAVKVLKFLGRKYLAQKMGEMMVEVLKNEPDFWPIDIIIPVPISPGNLKQRGFNQTELLAAQISRKLRIPMDINTLTRIKETPSQRELTKEEREKNLLCAFEIKEKRKIYRKNILLVDDVYTTGSTIRECTRVLLEAGGNRVSVITWATGKGF
ncbi:MAG: ComF family protein [Syntrophomonadaceae bacterium]|nr:ComF family protein [Syntrophomonadaceae bacterium]MDD3024414.1 ComF family protein [Syntrophomonadaceae bacterium]